MAIENGSLRDIPLKWIACWLLLPNLAVIALWPFIGVPMQAGLAISGVLAVAFSQLPWASARILGAGLVFLTITALYICNLFAIPPLNYGLLFQFISDVRPFRSPEYAVAIAAAFVLLTLTLATAPRVPRFQNRTQFLFALVGIGVLISLDGALASDRRLEGRRLPPEGTRVESAVSLTNIEGRAGERRNVLLIVVEALGAPAMPEEKALFAADWNRREWQARYEISSGSSKYFGSTTNGELRELCQRWAHYSEFDFDRADCLPGRFRDAGYETTAIHAFTGDLFDRIAWYPKIGFDNTIFSDDLFRFGAHECYGVFPGACDTDVPRVIGQQLARADKPQFVYWLTLNTHVPVIADEVMGTAHCVIGNREWRENFPSLCRLFQLHHHLADSISDMIMAKEFPETDILIVGDHKPPVFDRTEAGRFKDGVVPWIYLRAKPRTGTPSENPTL